MEIFIKAHASVGRERVGIGTLAFCYDLRQHEVPGYRTPNETSAAAAARRQPRHIDHIPMGTTAPTRGFSR